MSGSMQPETTLQQTTAADTSSARNGYPGTRFNTRYPGTRSIPGYPGLCQYPDDAFESHNINSIVPYNDQFEHRFIQFQHESV